MSEFERNYAAMVIRYDCRDHYRRTGELEAFKTYNKVEQAIWDTEVQAIQQEEALSA